MTIWKNKAISSVRIVIKTPKKAVEKELCLIMSTASDMHPTLCETLFPSNYFSSGRGAGEDKSNSPHRANTRYPM